MNRSAWRIVWSWGLLVTLAVATAQADEHSLATLEEAPPAEALSEGVVEAVQQTGVSVKRGSRVLANVWLAAQWKTRPNFQPSLSMLYPFQVGELLGVVEFKRTGEDFRGQEIAAGVYTVRYALQPEDGNHVGTSETRDFCLLLPAADDTAADPVALESMIELSKKAAQSNHPAMLCLLRAEDAAAEKPQLDHEDEHDWWILTLRGEAKGTGTLPLKLVLVGKAAE